MGWNRNGQPPLGKLSEVSLAYRERLKNCGPWLIMPYMFYKLMSPDEAHVMAYLWNLRDVLEMLAEVAPGDWFYCTTAKMEGHLGYNRQAQNRVFKKLVAKGYVQTQRRGIPAKRWVRINRKKIMADVDALVETA